MFGLLGNQHGSARFRRHTGPDFSDSSVKTPPRAQRAVLFRVALVVLVGQLVGALFRPLGIETFLGAHPHPDRSAQITRLAAADPRWRPASLLYEEEQLNEDYEFDDDNFDEITMDTIDVADLDDEDEYDEDAGLPPRKLNIKADVHPKFERTGYFERQDLERLDVSQFDRQGRLQELSIEDLERRLERRFKVSEKVKTPADLENPREPSKILSDDESDEFDDYNLFWTPGRRDLRPAKSQRPFRPRPVRRGQLETPQVPKLREPLREPPPATAKGRPSSRDLRTWMKSQASHFHLIKSPMMPNACSKKC